MGKLKEVAFLLAFEDARRNAKCYLFLASICHRKTKHRIL